MLIIFVTIAVKAEKAAAVAGKKPGFTFPEGANYVDVPVSALRKVAASRYLESKTTIPHYYLTIEVVVDNLLK